MHQTPDLTRTAFSAHTQGGAHQPRLQLSLDVVLWEHYVDVLSAGVRPGTAGASVAIRYGTWWEPIYNCHGVW
jgi:hypothetical protein